MNKEKDIFLSCTISLNIIHCKNFLYLTLTDIYGLNEFNSFNIIIIKKIMLKDYFIFVYNIYFRKKKKLLKDKINKKYLILKVIYS